MIQSNQIIDQDLQPNSKILLIDLENCPEQIHYLKENLEEFSKVIICYAQTGTKIPLDWLLPLSKSVNSNKLSIFKMSNGGKNSADFGICFFAGVLMEQSPKETHFVIVSNDTDLDHVVNLLKSQNRSAERIGTKKEEKKTPAIAIDPEIEALFLSVKIYCMHLISYSKNRPAKKDTLLNSIRSKFKDTPKMAEDILQLLIVKGVVTMSDNKVIYHDKKINEMANQS